MMVLHCIGKFEDWIYHDVQYDKDQLYYSKDSKATNKFSKYDYESLIHAYEFNKFRLQIQCLDSSKLFSLKCCTAIIALRQYKYNLCILIWAIAGTEVSIINVLSLFTMLRSSYSKLFVVVFLVSISVQYIPESLQFYV